MLFSLANEVTLILVSVCTSLIQSLKVYIGLDFDIIFTSLMVSSLAAITEDFIQESYLIHIVVGISVLNISFDISYDGTSVEEKI